MNITHELNANQKTVDTLTQIAIAHPAAWKSDGRWTAPNLSPERCGDLEVAILNGWEDKVRLIPYQEVGGARVYPGDVSGEIRSASLTKLLAHLKANNPELYASLLVEVGRFIR